jgi:hypothetical protein
MKFKVGDRVAFSEKSVEEAKRNGDCFGVSYETIQELSDTGAWVSGLDNNIIYITDTEGGKNVFGLLGKHLIKDDLKEKLEAILD